VHLTARGRSFIFRSLTSLPWLGLLGWAMSYSFWSAFILYVIFDRVMFGRYWGAEFFPRGDL